jgi:hypothetical protein
MLFGVRPMRAPSLQSQCFCGYDLPTVESPEQGDCNMGCSGAPLDEDCGGSLRLSVYSNHDLTGPSTNAGSGNFRSLRYYSNNVGGRALPAQVGYEGKLTVTKCAVACASHGFALAGVEYGQGM